MYNIKYVSKNGNFEVIYNPDLGAPVVQYTKMGKLIDMDYDPINMGTFNYVYNQNELSNGLGGLPHLKFDVQPYTTDEYYIDGNPWEEFKDFFGQITNKPKGYGNVWL